MSNAKKKHGRRRKHGKLLVIIGIVVVIVAAFLVILVMRDAFSGKGKEEQGENVSAESNQIVFPCESEDGSLRFSSLIQFSGPNMDADNQVGEDIAGLEVENISDQYIKEVSVQLLMEDGSEYNFLIQDLPAGKKILAMELESQEYDGQTACQQIDSSVQKEEITMEEAAFRIEETGSALDITNITEQQIEEAVVYYHCAAGDSYIGGMSGKIAVSKLAAGESFSYEDPDILLGTPQAVGVEIN